MLQAITAGTYCSEINRALANGERAATAGAEDIAQVIGTAASCHVVQHLAGFGTKDNPFLLAEAAEGI
jgi:hypothetical protein